MTDEETPEKLRLGGMALGNGLLVHGSTHWAAAIRTRKGEIKTASGPKPRIKGLDGVPAARGVARLAEAFTVIPLVKRALPQAKLPLESGKVLAATVGAMAAGSALKRRGSIAGEAAAAGISILPALVALRAGDLAAYHGVEHKAIAAYEQDSDAADAAKEHDRCGSNLVLPMLVSNVAGAALLKRIVARPTPLAGAAVSLASAGIAVEAFIWAERNADSAPARAFRRPGHELQRAMGTREPSAEQLEVGRAALEEILRVEGAA